MPTRRERLEGGLIGLLVGDALGVPYEFHSPQSLPPKSQIEFEPPLGFPPAHASTPAGTWSDDGAQALCLLASLLNCDDFDAHDFMQRVTNWRERGYLAVDARVFDIGITTAQAIGNFQNGLPAPSGERDNGNGALMRVLPLVLWQMAFRPHEGDEFLARRAMAQSVVTHGHLRSQLCCALYCLWAKNIFLEMPNAWQTATQTLRAIHAENLAATRELETHVRPDDYPHGEGTGYVVDCLHSARLACERSTFEDVVKTAVALGNDTDTTACVASGIAGIRDGIDCIPTRWRENLRGQEIVAPILKQLLAPLSN